MSTTEPVDTLETTGACPKYDEYEDSGVEWLGEIPSRWTTAKLKYCIQSLVSGATPKSTEDEYWASDDEEGVPWVAVGDMSETSWVDDTEKRVTKEGIDEADLETLPEGTLLYSIYASLGEVAVLDIPATTNQAILGITPDRDLVSRDFLYYWLRHMRRHVEVLSSSNTQDNLSAGRVRNMPVYIPELQEQRTITTFLDRETERVDALIEKKERLIDLLEEKRTALISRVVTKGLDPDVEMQDSGVEWLGGIPAQWETGKVAHLFDNLDSERIPVSSSNRADMQGEYPYYGASGVIDHVDDYLFDEPLILVAEDGANLLSRSTPLAFVARGKYWVNNHAHILRPRYEPLEYWAYVLRSIVYDPWITGSAQPKLNQENLDSIELPMPPEKERLRITERLNDERLQINHLIDKVEEGADRLKEYRTALISAAVTGQIDVREEVGSAPVE